MTDLLVVWDWEYDAAFVRTLLDASRAAGVSAAAVAARDVQAAAAEIQASGRVPRVLVDRASDVSAEVRQFATTARRLGTAVLNDPDRAIEASDKATMHLRLLGAGVHVPWTILLAPLGERRPGELDDLPNVGTPFVVKPARGGGGEGVVLGASCLTDILLARSQHANDRYLVQQRVVPTRLRERPAYFRVIHALGEVYPCFWDPATSRYAPVSPEDRSTDWCRELERVTRVTARVSDMAIFSTELALTAPNVVVSVDYVNDMCDLRPASEAADGVPDAIVEAVAARIVRLASTLTAAPRV